MTTYNQLLADIVSMTDNDEAGAWGPTAVVLAESRHKREIRVRAMERRSVASGNGTRYLSLPEVEPYLEMRRLMRGDRKLTYLAPESLTFRNGGGAPRFYTLHQEIEFDTALDATDEVEMIYYTPFPALSISNQTNWLIENAYPVYLFAALAETSPYLYEDERVAGWNAKYLEAAAALQREDDKGEVHQGQARVWVSGPTP